MSNKKNDDQAHAYFCISQIFFSSLKIKLKVYDKQVNTFKERCAKHCTVLYCIVLQCVATQMDECLLKSYYSCCIKRHKYCNYLINHLAT